jgi:hypothetical protein
VSKSVLVRLSVLGDTVIYLDEQIVSHRKILRAGRLIGDAKGGVIAALGLFVAAIGYARSHLTDGVVPDEFLQEVSRNSDAITAMRKAKLLRPLRGNLWRIHDYLKWNPSAAQVEHERALAKKRQQVFRRKSTGFPQGCNGVTSEAGERRSNATVTLDPRSPIPDPLVRTTAATVRTAAPPSVVSTKEQRPGGRDTHPPTKADERREALTRQPAADGNYAVIVKLAHTIIDSCGITDPESIELVERVKHACAQQRIDYATNPGVVRRALSSAVTQRTGLQAVAPMATALTTATTPAALQQQLRAMAQRTMRARR